MKQQFVVNVPTFRPNVGGQDKALSDQEVLDTIREAAEGMARELDKFTAKIGEFAETERKLRADIAELQARQPKAAANQEQAASYDTLPD